MQNTAGREKHISRSARSSVARAHLGAVNKTGGGKKRVLGRNFPISVLHFLYLFIWLPPFEFRNPPAKTRERPQMRRLKIGPASARKQEPLSKRAGRTRCLSFIMSIIGVTRRRRRRRRWRKEGRKRSRAKKTTADQVVEGLQFECRGDVSAAGRHVKSNALVSINH